VLDQEDIKKFCDGFVISVSQFKKKSLKPDEEQGKFVFKEKPCPFLKNNLCSNYSHRPKDCKSYPHLHKKEFVFRLWGVVENCSICPIVFNVYEQLKDELWYPGNGRFEDDQEDICY
jgi:Fe-S-cluster containining protein